jgi:PAS domain S-box-containing protein
MSETRTQTQLEADLAAMAVPGLDIEAQAFLTELATAMFPDGAPTRERVTWPDPPGGIDRGAAADRAQDPVHDAEARLRAAEARFRTLVEQIPAVTFMAVLGEGKNEIYVSPHIEQLLGYTQKEWLEDPFLWYWRLHPDDRQLWNEEFARGCRTGGPFRAECRFLARDGHVVWVHGEARIARDDLGRPLFLQGVAFDITETKKAQDFLLAQAVRKAKADEELEIAKRVQTSILPRSLEVPGYRIAAAMRPADDVGGDYYDLLDGFEGAWLAIGDVSGHGLDAGLVMLMVQSAMAAIARARPFATPRDMLSALNDVLYDNIRLRLRQRDHVTFTLCKLGYDGSFVFAGAHEDVLLRRASSGRIERLRTPGTWLGAKRGIDGVTVDTMLRLDHGDLVVLYTDGVTEAKNAAGRQFDIDGLCTAIAETADRTPEEIRDHILARVRAWMKVQDDDISVVVIRRE